jgi:hypothetical protein
VARPRRSSDKPGSSGPAPVRPDPEAAAQGVPRGLKGLMRRAAGVARDAGAGRISSGHVWLALLEDDEHPVENLTRDLGVDSARVAGNIDRLAKMDEGMLDDAGRTQRLVTAIDAAVDRAGRDASAELLTTRLAAELAAAPDTVAHRALDNAGLSPAKMAERLDRLSGGSAPTADGETASPAAVPLSEWTPTAEEIAAVPIDGDYKTAAQRKPFRAQVIAGDIHIYSGARFTKRRFDGEGNSVYWTKETVIAETVTFIRRLGEVELGSCREATIPEPHTLEAFLRQFSINGNLASYLPAILESLGAIRIEKRKGGVHWAVAEPPK